MAVALVQKQNSGGFLFPGGAQLSQASTSMGASPTSGNFLIGAWALNGENGSRVVSVPAGWTTLPTTAVPSSDHTLHLGWRWAGGSEPSTWTWTWTVACSALSETIFEFSGVDATTPIDVIDAAWTNQGAVASGSTYAVPSQTTVTNGALDLIFTNTRFQSGYVISTSGYAELDDTTSWGVYSKTITTAGATGQRDVVTTNAGFDRGMTFSLALRPSGGGGGGSTFGPLTNGGALIRGGLIRGGRLAA